MDLRWLETIGRIRMIIAEPELLFHDFPHLYVQYVVDFNVPCSTQGSLVPTLCCQEKGVTLAVACSPHQIFQVRGTTSGNSTHYQTLPKSCKYLSDAEACCLLPQA